MSSDNVGQHPAVKALEEAHENLRKAQEELEAKNAENKAKLEAQAAEAKAKFEAAKPEVDKLWAALTPEQRADRQEKLARIKEKFEELRAKLAAENDSRRQQ
jgi:hypothetical protein